MQNLQHKALKTALQWYVDHGVDEALGDEALDRRALKAMSMPEIAVPAGAQESVAEQAAQAVQAVSSGDAPLLGASDARAESAKLAGAAHDFDALRAAIEGFDGLAVKKTATNMVFCDGNVAADLMLIGEAPGADEDRQGKPFVGQSGQLLDRILACIDLDRTAQEAKKSVYISNILNWRPPGNRTPTPAEMDVSLPFIEKHIMLAQPKVIVLCGATAAKALLGTNDSISKMRGCIHEYKPRTPELGYDGPAIPVIATYHPAYLLQTPAQKRAVWKDMLMLQAHMKTL